MNTKTSGRFQKILKNKEFDPPLGNNFLDSIPLQQAVQMAQKAVRRYVVKGTSLVDDLIQARREEADRE